MSNRSSERMNGWRIDLTRFERLQLLLGGLCRPRRAVVEVAVDELDGLEEAAGGFALPDLAEAAAAEPLDEPVAGDRLGLIVE